MGTGVCCDKSDYLFFPALPAYSICTTVRQSYCDYRLIFAVEGGNGEMHI